MVVENMPQEHCQESESSDFVWSKLLNDKAGFFYRYLKMRSPIFNSSSFFNKLIHKRRCYSQFVEQFAIRPPFYHFVYKNVVLGPFSGKIIPNSLYIYSSGQRILCCAKNCLRNLLYFSVFHIPIENYSSLFPDYVMKYTGN